MKSLSLVVIAAALATLAGCAADADNTAASSNEDMTAEAAPAVKLAGAYRASEDSSEGASFKGIVFNTNGHFFADVDTAVRCIKAPCDGATARLSGTYTVSGHTVTLAPVANAFEEFYGTYNVTVSGNAISLSRSGSESAAAVTGTDLQAETSYCAAAVDCGSQNIVHPMCAPSHWTCGAQNACAFACGN